MAIKVVVMEGTRQMVHPQPWCGKRPYTSPEALHQDDQGSYDSPLTVKTDVWSMGVTILYVLTDSYRHRNDVLWQMPRVTDVSYNIFIESGGLTSDDVLYQETERYLNTYTRHDATGLVQKMEKVRQLDPLLRDLLSRMLQPNVDQRASVEELLQHKFVSVEREYAEEQEEEEQDGADEE
jgi:serine/threonine protein kinase